MIRAAAALAIAGAAACAGPSSTVPTGFGSSSSCVSGPRIAGETEMGVTDKGFHTDTDASIVMTGRTGGGCVGAVVDADR